MTRSRGSVKPTPDGRFRARYSAGDDPVTGQRVQRARTFDDRRSAQAWLTAELHQLDSGQRQRRLTAGQTLATFLREFYSTDRRGLKGRTLSPRTCQVDMDLLERYVIRRAPALAETPLGRLSTDACARHFRWLADGDSTHGPLAKATVSRVFRVVKARLSHAVKLGHLRANPLRSDLIPIDGKAAKQHRTLTAEQAQSLLAVAHTDRYGLGVALLTWTGLRPGEGFGLTWDDVDFEGQALIVRRALVRTRGAWELRGTKTDTTRRVPIPASLTLQLAAHRRTQAAERLLAGAEYQNHGLVFATEWGLPVHLDLVAARHFKPLLVMAAYHLLGRTRPPVPVPSRSQRYRDAMDARSVADASALADASFPLISLYELRHGVATMLLRANVHPKIVGDRLGHARTSTTLDIYSHVSPDMQSRALTELEAALTPTLRKA